MDRRDAGCLTALAVEDEPAELVAEPLVVQDELPDLVGQLIPLPTALGTPGLFFVVGSGGLGCPDRVGGGTELVGGHVRDGSSLAGGVRSVSRPPAQVSCRCVRMAGSVARFGHGYLASCPGTRELDRPARPLVVRPGLLEQVQHTFSAVGGPDREAVMILIAKASAATHGDEPRIADLRQDHFVESRRPRGTDPADRERMLNHAR